jgi:4-amino-4-deoxy-L-arabinose transferase-like glycosyltransferase
MPREQIQSDLKSPGNIDRSDSIVNPKLQRCLSWMPPQAWLMVIVLVCLVPFINKAFFIDDTLFLRAAEQIQKHPLDFYGFTINWFDRTLPMTDSTENPPLASYYIAAVASLAGWSERVLHLAFLLPALAAAWGTYSLAKNHCRRPFLAALIAVLTPAFLISATTVMCDVMLLAFWVWTLVVFERALPKNSIAAFVACGCLAGLAAWTKFFGLALVPLLAVYGLCRVRRAGWWMTAFIIPLLFAAVYECIGYKLYGHEMFLSAAHYSNHAHARTFIKLGQKIIIGLGFVGGCFLPALFYLPLLWSRRIILAMPCLMAAGLFIFPHMPAFAWVLWNDDGSLKWGVFFESAILTVAGVYVVILTIADLWKNRDTASLLIFLWMGGVLVFTIGVNWSINGRSLLPAVPVLGILVARRMEQRGVTHGRWEPWQLFGPAVLAGVVGMFLAKADYDLANTNRAAAKLLLAQRQESGKPLWFQGHWGFQYYMEHGGAKPVEMDAPRLTAGTVVVVPTQDKEDYLMATSSEFHLLEVKKYEPNTLCATMDPAAGAGFYSADLGPLPFAMTGMQPQYFWVYQVVPPNEIAPGKTNGHD